MKYEYAATIETTSGFPLDMLRYDHCYPISQEDVAAIDESLQEHKSVIVHVGKASNRRQSRPFTEARWESFGCKIVKIDIDYHPNEL